MRSVEARERKRAYDRLVLRVKRGVPVLDERMMGWRQNVDPAKLDMGRHSRCVVGQQPGGYKRNIAYLAGSTNMREIGDWAIKRGLEAGEQDYAGGLDPYETLTRIWRKLVFS